MPLFDVAITEEPTKREKEEGAVERLIYSTSKPIIAKDMQTASINAFLECKEKVNKERMKVHVRPF